MNHISVEGTYVESCSCGEGCLCCAPNSPTQGHCQVAAAWQISEGRVDETSVSGVGVVQVMGVPCVAGGAAQRQFIVDQRATPQQREAIEHLLTHSFSRRPPTFGDLSANQEAEIRYAEVVIDHQGDSYHVRVPGVADTRLDLTPNAASFGRGRDMEIGSLDCDSPRTYAFISRFKWSE